MKSIIGLFIIAFISVGIADLIQGVILTLIYTPNTYSTGGLEMANIIKYSTYAITVTIAFWSVSKVKNMLKKVLS
ncbi:hypothetical protein D1B33_14595 [Lysinibacillus yapensis]|uniref:Uncharacterized protein n=1 Tax=Ureibacillus yapensis TaxID=2304605 RepID=A0A396SAZ2_9BACL|nr:hypothetical protein [Lysinibacillus yapensis]RHW34025.1 hypothetical protein D1B33_14595 [Lysinibacillus yapensis]